MKRNRAFRNLFGKQEIAPIRKKWHPFQGMRAIHGLPVDGLLRFAARSGGAIAAATFAQPVPPRTTLW